MWATTGSAPLNTGGHHLGILGGINQAKGADVLVSLARHWARNKVKRRMIARVVHDLIDASEARFAAAAPADIDAVRNHGGRLVGFSDEVGEAHVSLKRFLYANLYSHPDVIRMQDRSREIVIFSGRIARVQRVPSAVSPRIRRMAGPITRAAMSGSPSQPWPKLTTPCSTRRMWARATPAISSADGVKAMRFWLLVNCLSDCREMQPRQRALQVCDVGRGAS